MPSNTPGSIEIAFTPTARDYAQATRWITRKALGQTYWLNFAAIASIAIAGAFGFIMLLDAAINSPFPEIADQGMVGALLFIGVLYVGLALKIAVKRFIARRLYVENGFYLAPRTMTFTSEALHNNSVSQQMTIKWTDVLGIFETKDHLFIQLEPAFTLFIPKRIANTPEEITRLRDFANKMRAESASKV